MATSVPSNELGNFKCEGTQRSGMIQPPKSDWQSSGAGCFEIQDGRVEVAYLAGLVVDQPHAFASKRKTSPSKRGLPPCYGQLKDPGDADQVATATLQERPRRGLRGQPLQFNICTGYTVDQDSTLQEEIKLTGNTRILAGPRPEKIAMESICLVSAI